MANERDSRLAAAVLLAVLLSACQPPGPAPQTAATAASAPAPSDTAEPPFKQYSLTLVGMNYTRRYIDSFSVNGQGGGNLYVSTPTSGGGKSVCCVGWHSRRTLPVTVTVRWQAGGCKTFYPGISTEGERLFNITHTFKEKRVVFNGPVPADPAYFVVHIYEDDHVEVGMAHDYPEPKVKLDESREDNTPYPECKGEPNGQ